MADLIFEIMFDLEDNGINVTVLRPDGLTAEKLAVFPISKASLANAKQAAILAAKALAPAMP